MPAPADGFWHRFRLAFTASGLTQAELGRRVHRHQSTVSDWLKEGGGRRALPDGEAMLLLPPALGVTYDWLLGGRGPRYPSGRSVSASRQAEDGRQEVLLEVRRLVERLGG